MAGVAEAWIVEAVRTPIGRHGGALSSVRPDDLAALTLRALCDRSGVPPSEVEDVVLGCANQAGEDNRNVARMAVLLAGFPTTVAGSTVNRLCGSGLEAVASAARALMLGEADVFIAGGVESMSRAPWAVPKSEKPFPTGPVTMHDTTLGWRFVNARLEALGHTEPLGITAENLALGLHLQPPGEPPPDEVADQHRIGRVEQDEFALRSHVKAIEAIDGRRFDDEIVAVPVSSRSGPQEVLTDEGPRRDTTRDKLASLRPAFRHGGSVTAGNSSSLNDGAASLLLVSDEYGRSHGLRPLVRIRSMAVAGVPPSYMGIGPVPATQKALERAGISLADIGLIELNEAFAAQTLAVLRAWNIGPEDPRVNASGGAIALGHPLGCSGARLLVTLAHQMRRRPDVQFALATMCIGVGQGISMVVEQAT